MSITKLKEKIHRRISAGVDPELAKHMWSLKPRIDAEVAEVIMKKMTDLFMFRHGGKRIGFSSVLKNKNLSIVGYLTGTLRLDETPWVPTDDFAELLRRNRIAKAEKQPSLSPAHLLSLTLAGAFGPPELVIKKYRDCFPQKLDVENFDEEMAARTFAMRMVDLDDVKARGYKPISYDLFMHPASFGHTVQIAGQFTGEVHKFQTVRGTMATIELETIESDCDEIMPVTIWSDGMCHFEPIEDDLTQGSILICQGTRSVYKNKRRVQLEIDGDTGKIEVFDGK